MFGRSLEEKREGWRDIYVYIREEILKFSCRQPPVCRGAAPITLSAHSSTYPPVSCPRYFSSSFRRRRDTWERCAPAHTIDFICVHTVTYSQRGLVSSSRIDTHTHTRVSFSLFRSFFCSLTRDTRTRSFCNDRINRGNRCFVSPRNDHVCLSSIDSSSNAILFPNVIRGKVNAIESINDNNQSSLSRIFFV